MRAALILGIALTLALTGGMSLQAAPKSLRSVTPLLQVSDLPASIAFYTKKLGFQKTYEEEEGFVILARGDVEIFLGKNQTGVNLRNSTARAKRDGYASYDLHINCDPGVVDELWKEFRAAGVPMSAAFAKGPVDRDYGIRDFSITDPDGYDIIFGSPLGKK